MLFVKIRCTKRPMALKRWGNLVMSKDMSKFSELSSTGGNRAGENDGFYRERRKQWRKKKREVDSKSDKETWGFTPGSRCPYGEDDPEE